jgi:hypothetical protein
MQLATVAGAKLATSGATRARAREAEVAAVLAELLHDYASPGATERALLEAMAAEIVRARRARTLGRAREASDANRLISRLGGQLGLRRDKRPGKPSGPSLQEYLAQRAAAAPVAQPPRDAVEVPSADEARHGALHDGGEATESEASDAE